MFTGIIETIGTIKKIEKHQQNLNVSIDSGITNELKIDQSLAHNGVCLTVISIKNSVYTVTAIAETLQKTNISFWKEGDFVNLERAMKFNDRLDGHIVQGHVDQTAICSNIKETDGSWLYTFEYDTKHKNITIEKGSITVNGVSLTVINSQKGSFSVAIIPYTYENTNFKYLTKNSIVNIEFDVIGKYVARIYNERFE